MSQLIPSNGSVMSTIELLNLVNAAREQSGESVVRRNDFHSRVKDELDGEHYETFVVPNGNGTQSEVMRLTRDQCMYVLMRESKQVRRAVTARLNAMFAASPAANASEVQIRHELVRDYCTRFSNLGAAAQQVLYAKILNPVLGGDVLPLPVLEQQHLSAKDVGAKLGVSGNAVGRAAKKHGLKTKEYGIWVLDKSASSDKQVEVFKYNDAGIQKLESILHAPVGAPGEAQPDLLGGV